MRLIRCQWAAIFPLYATGEGQTFPAGVDGALAMSVYPKPLLNVTMSVGGVPVVPVYAGAAPTEVLGLSRRS